MRLRLEVEKLSNRRGRVKKILKYKYTKPKKKEKTDMRKLGTLQQINFAAN